MVLNKRKEIDLISMNKKVLEHQSSMQKVESGVVKINNFLEKTPDEANFMTMTMANIQVQQQ